MDNSTIIFWNFVPSFLFYILSSIPVLFIDNRNKKILYLIIVTILSVVAFIVFLFFPYIATYFHDFFMFHQDKIILFLGLIIGIIIYHFILKFHIKHDFKKIRNIKIENFNDFIAGHRRYKIIHDFESYCKNGIQMILRAEKKFKNNNKVTMYSVQMHSQDLSETDEKAYQDYIKSTYEVLFSNSWNYVRLIFLPIEDNIAFIKAFSRSYCFIRTLLLEYYYSNIDVNDIESLRLPKLYKFGINKKVDISSFKGQSAKLVDIDKFGDGIKKICLGYTSRINGLLDLVSKLDVHLPPGDEFSIAFTNENQFEGCIRVSEQDSKVCFSNKTTKNKLKNLFIELFIDHFNNNYKKKSNKNKGWIFVSDIIERIELVGLKSNDISENAIYNNWKDLKLDTMIFDALFEEAKLYLPNEKISSLQNETIEYFIKNNLFIHDE
jgi:hypothetical protein